MDIETIYISNLRRMHSYYFLNSGMAYVVAGADSCGKLTRTYCVIQKVVFYSASNVADRKVLMVCSCEESTSQRERLLATDKNITELLHTFLERERLVYYHFVSRIGKSVLAPGV